LYNKLSEKLSSKNILEIFEKRVGEYAFAKKDKDESVFDFDRAF